jgi:predicted metal-dependent hydrolase
MRTLTFGQRTNSMQEQNPRCRDHPTPEMLHAFEQFNHGEYWHQHETLELVWRAEKDESIRNFYKGILQVGVGFHHITRRNYRGVDKVLTRGINYLKPYAPRCMGVDVQRLMDEATTVLEQVHALGPDRIDEIKIAELPRLQFEP